METSVLPCGVPPAVLGEDGIVIPDALWEGSRPSSSRTVRVGRAVSYLRCLSVSNK